MTGETRTPARVQWWAVAIFVVLAFGLAWLVTAPLWVSGGLASPLAGILLVVMMFTPAAAAIVVVFAVEKQRPKAAMRSLGMWPLRPVGRTLALVGIGIGVSILIVVLGALLAAALGLVKLDLVTFSGFAALISAAAGSRPIPLPMGVLVALQLAAIPVGALVNGFFTIGEELGWRGWLLPALRPLGTWPALLITGAIWGLWHSPVILLGYNFNEPNLLGVGLMIVGTTLYGVFVGWLRLRSNSIWPSVFAHGAFNAAAGFLLLVSVAGTSVSSPALNPLGWVTWIVMAAVIGALVLTGQLKKLPS